MVNGVDVQEHMNGGTSVIPNLDYIQEFRVLTNNFDPEYGNYNGGMVNVVTKSGSFRISAQHRPGRAQLLQRRGRSLPAESVRWNARRPILKDKLFFLDYQDTRTTEGISAPATTVLSSAERSGNFSDAESTLTGTVNGPYIAQLLGQKLGYGVNAGEPYYTPNCTDTIQCVFPNAVIPQSVWSAPGGGAGGSNA